MHIVYLPVFAYHPKVATYVRPPKLDPAKSPPCRASMVSRGRHAPNHFVVYVLQEAKSKNCALYRPNDKTIIIQKQERVSSCDCWCLLVNVFVCICLFGFVFSQFVFVCVLAEVPRAPGYPRSNWRRSMSPSRLSPPGSPVGATGEGPGTSGTPLDPPPERVLKV